MDEMDVNFEETLQTTLGSLQTDCPHCCERAEAHLRAQHEFWKNVRTPVPEENWFCYICDKQVSAHWDVLPLSAESAKVKEYREKGYYLRFYDDVWLCYELEENVTLSVNGPCADENCELCDPPLDWRALKSDWAYQQHLGLFDEEEGGI